LIHFITGGESVQVDRQRQNATINSNESLTQQGEVFGLTGHQNNESEINHGRKI